jgi:Hemerythrin HHE cation binding domain
MSHAVNSAADQSAAQAVVRHHAQLAAGLDQRVEALVQLVDGEYLRKAESARQDLLAYLRGEILSHARAEEEALYPPAAAHPTGRLLVEGMIAEHRALAGLVTELSDARSLVRAAAAGRALGALFTVHLAKENDMVLPLLVAASKCSEPATSAMTAPPTSRRPRGVAAGAAAAAVTSRPHRQRRRY